VYEDLDLTFLEDDELLIRMVVRRVRRQAVSENVDEVRGCARFGGSEVRVLGCRVRRSGSTFWGSVLRSEPRSAAHRRSRGTRGPLEPHLANHRTLRTL